MLNLATLLAGCLSSSAERDTNRLWKEAPEQHFSSPPCAWGIKANVSFAAMASFQRTHPSTPDIGKESTGNAVSMAAHPGLEGHVDKLGGWENLPLNVPPLIFPFFQYPFSHPGSLQLQIALVLQEHLINSSSPRL